MLFWTLKIYQANVYLFQVKNGNARTRCHICSKLTTKTLEGREWRYSGVFITNPGYIPLLVLALIWVGFLGVDFEVGEGKITPSPPTKTC